MKRIILIIALMGLNASASDTFKRYGVVSGGDAGGGRSEVVRIDRNRVEALISEDGVYARMDDLFEGVEVIPGAEFDSLGDLLIENTNAPSNEVMQILYESGQRAKRDSNGRFRILDGGDAGGG